MSKQLRQYTKQEVSRKLANDVAIWFFDQIEEDELDVENFFKSANNWTPEQFSGNKFSSDMWAELLATAISAFNEGLDEYIDMDKHNVKRANQNNDISNYNNAISLVGKEAFQLIAFLVAAADFKNKANTING